jgi:hypothetical protein
MGQVGRWRSLRGGRRWSGLGAIVAAATREDELSTVCLFLVPGCCR